MADSASPDSPLMVIFTGIAAVAAVGSAVVAIVQAKSAKRQAEESASQAYHASTSATAAKAQAEAAGQQVTLMAAQVKAAEEANRLTAQALAHEQEARKFWLSVTAEPTQEDGEWWLDVTIENNSQVDANIQSIAVLLAGQAEYSEGKWSGEIEIGRTVNGVFLYGLPAMLRKGSACKFRFGEERYVPSTPGGIVLPGTPKQLFPPDYESPAWRQIRGILVRANNQDCFAEMGHWYQHFQNGYSSMKWKGGRTV